MTSAEGKQEAGKTRIVFLGAGLVGANLVQSVAKKIPGADFTLVDTRNFFENNTGNVRSVVVPGFHAKTVKPHSEWMPKNVKLIVGRATLLTKENTVIVDGTTTVPFDFLVIQTGSRYPLFKGTLPTLDARTEQINGIIAQVKAAKSVLIVGGGQVGVEVAAEVISEHKDKKVTLVHPHERLVQNGPVKLSTKLATWFRQHKVTVILGERVQFERQESKEDKKGDEKKSDELTMQTYKTDKGKTIEADLLLDCAGAKANTEFMREHFADALRTNGRIRVTRSFLVEGSNNIFAVGDACNADPCPLNSEGQNHIPVVTENLARLVNAKGKASPSLKTYGGSTRLWGPATAMGPGQVSLDLALCCCCVIDVNLEGKAKIPYATKVPANS